MPKTPLTKQTEDFGGASLPAVSTEITTQTLIQAQVGPDPLATLLPATSVTVRIQPGREYVSGRPFYASTAFLQSLSFVIDDVTAAFGADVYDRMMLDSQVGSDVATLIEAALATLPQATPAISQWDTDGKTGQRTENPEWKLAKEIADFVTRLLCGSIVGMAQENPIAMRDMLESSFVGGNKIAEKVAYPLTSGQDAGRIAWALRPKPRISSAYVVDAYYHVLGIVSVIPGVSSTLITQSLVQDLNQLPNFLPRWKAAVLTHRQHDGDPRGQSGLRKAYNAWFDKIQFKISEMNYAARFLGGFVFGETPENAQGTVSLYNADGTPQIDVSGLPIVITIEEAMRNGLQLLQSGAVFVYPHGGNVQVIFPPSDNPYEAMIDSRNKEISIAISGQSRMTQDAKRSGLGNGDTDAAQDVFALRVAALKRSLLSMLASDFVADVVRSNWGEKYLHLAPVLTMSQTSPEDIAAEITAASAAGWSFAPSQLAWFDNRIGATPRTDADIAQAQEQKQAQIESAKKPPAALPNPALGGAKPSAGAKFSEKEPEKLTWWQEWLNRFRG